MLSATENQMTIDSAHDIFERTRRFAGGHELEVIISGGRSALTRFANNMIHQNVAEEGMVISVRVAFDGKTARATTNKTDDESLRRAVEAATQLTRVQESDPLAGHAKLLKQYSDRDLHNLFAYLETLK